MSWSVQCTYNGSPDSVYTPTRVVSFQPGNHAGFGQDRLPDIVLGPPHGAGDRAGSTDVLSLGTAGQICLAFDQGRIVDRPGPDFIVFENPFIPFGAQQPFAEYGEVSVSADGVQWTVFPCDLNSNSRTHCAGKSPVFSNPDNSIAPDAIPEAGGDLFDLADVGLSTVRFICIRDLSTFSGASPTAGFDLDAVVAVHFE